MLLIRDAQIEALRLDRRRHLEKHLTARLAAQYPEDYASLGETGAILLVRQTLEIAARFHIQSEAAIATLLRLLVEFGLELELAPFRSWAMRILSHPALPGEMKVNLVGARLFGLAHGNRMLLHRDEE